MTLTQDMPVRAVLVAIGVRAGDSSRAPAYLDSQGSPDASL